MSVQQQNSPESYRPDSRPDDEIDLRELVRAVWDTRVPVLLSVLGFAVLFWLGVMALGARSGLLYSWDAEIQFTFNGVGDGQYPDETPFTPNDLLSPVIVQRVYEQNDLESQGLSLSNFSNALSISAHAPTRQFIVQRFRQELQRGGSSSTEINQIEQRFAQALERASRSYAILTLDLRDGLMPTSSVLNDQMVRKVLLDIPRVWAKYMTEEAGVFAKDLRLYSAQAISGSVLGVMDEIVTADIIKSKFLLLRSNIEAIEELYNSGTVRDPETGLRLGDIEAQADWLENFVLEEARATLVGGSVGSNPDVTIRFFRGRIEQLSRQRDLLLQRAERVEEALQSYNQGSGGRTSTAGSGMGGSLGFPEDLRGGTTIPQFGSDFLDRLVELGGDSGDVLFRQELTRERLDYHLEAADLQAEISRLQQLAEMIMDQQDASQTAFSDAMRAEIDAVKSQIDRVSSGLESLVAATGRIADRLNALRYGGQEAIYAVVNPPGEASRPALILTRSNLQRFVLGAFLIALIAVMGVFLYNMLRARTDADAES